MTAKAAFKQDDVTRALKGVKAAGIEAATIRLRPSGEIVIQIGTASNPDSGLDEWRGVLDEAQTPPT